MKHARRLLCVLLSSPCLFAAGCLIPYAYPKLDCVPGAHVGTTTNDVSTFRVDVSAHQADIGEEGTFELTEIEPRYDGSLPAQFGASVERGYYVFGVALNYNVGRLHATRVRLYRPGYQLVELPAWGSTKNVAWITAPDWQSQEQAIDDLLQRPAVSASARGYVRKQGTFWNDANQPRRQTALVASPATTRAFALAAAEYERVAKLAPTEADATRLHEKAERLLEVKPVQAPIAEAGP